MESNSRSPPHDDNVDAKASATFRKPTNDAVSRKYRRRSGVGESSSSEESPTRQRISSPSATRKDHEKTIDKQRDGGRELDRNSRRGQYGRGCDSSRYFESQSSRSSHDYRRRDDSRRNDRYTNDFDRGYSRSSHYSDRKENEYRPRHYERDSGKYSRDKSDRFGDKSRDCEKESLSNDFRKAEGKDFSSDKAGSVRGHRSPISEDIDIEEGEVYEDKRDTEKKIVHQRSSRNYKPDYSPAYEHSRSHKNESTSLRDRSGYHQKETSLNDDKFLDDGGYSKLGKKSSDLNDRLNRRYDKKSEEQFDYRKKYYSKDHDSSAKKPKLFGSNRSTEDGIDVTKEKAARVDNQRTNSKSVQEPSDNGNSEQARVTNSDIDAAKLAAMKAAELVNHNLIGTGYMSAEQKKKLLWGNKKTAATEESGNRWDTTTFGDPERQEKFHKLMSLRLHWYLLPIVGCERRHQSGTQVGRPRYHREAEGATPTGFREAIHCWTSSQRWSHCWTRSLKFCCKCHSVCESHFNSTLYHFETKWLDTLFFLALVVIKMDMLWLHFSPLIWQPSLSFESEINLIFV